MQQFKTKNKNGLIQVWTLADYGFDRELMRQDFEAWQELGMIYEVENEKNTRAGARSYKGA